MDPSISLSLIFQNIFWDTPIFIGALVNTIIVDPAMYINSTKFQWYTGPSTTDPKFNGVNTWIRTRATDDRRAENDLCMGVCANFWTCGITLAYSHFFADLHLRMARHKLYKHGRFFVQCARIRPMRRDKCGCLSLQLDPVRLINILTFRYRTNLHLLRKQLPYGDDHGHVPSIDGGRLREYVQQ